MTDQCQYTSCEEPATQPVKSIRGTERLCDNHAWIVRQIEAEWDQAEAEYLEQR